MSQINKNPILITIEGIIGVGKSTILQILIKILKKHHNIKAAVIQEPVEIWEKVGILQEFYKNPKAKAYEFQTFVYSTRLQMLIDGVKNNPEADLFIAERSIFTDKHTFVKMLKESGCFSESQWQMYETWSTVWLKQLPFDKIGGFIYLCPSIEEAMKRISVRSRDVESSVVTSDYQEKLKEKHDEFFSGIFVSGKQTKDSKVVEYSTGMVKVDESAHLIPFIKVCNDDDYRNDTEHVIFDVLKSFILTILEI